MTKRDALKLLAGLNHSLSLLSCRPDTKTAREQILKEKTRLELLTATRTRKPRHADPRPDTSHGIDSQTSAHL